MPASPPAPFPLRGCRGADLVQETPARGVWVLCPPMQRWAEWGRHREVEPRGSSGWVLSRAPSLHGATDWPWGRNRQRRRSLMTSLNVVHSKVTRAGCLQQRGGTVVPRALPDPPPQPAFLSSRPGSGEGGEARASPSSRAGPRRPGTGWPSGKSLCGCRHRFLALSEHPDTLRVTKPAASQLPRLAPPPRRMREGGQA